ncbi:hypothetical protein GPA27_12490 [Aromatoleum toluolicum]|uniref:DUF5681 domain-containing protein n=1 Tax=Aromatoleum toluolicum TaxID=90060 RepID=A0ABX1NFW0_9RHOO|nr:hypothetical protein [Aromatoleum toluolicum]NMF98203.1 hypothetical protein [Aromatoleum toluolicum]
MTDETRKCGPNAGKRDACGRFAKGNPGKPRGTRHRATTLALGLFESGIEDIAKTVVELARGGDLAAAKLVVDKLIPPTRERPINIALPPVADAAGVAAAAAAVVQAVADGELMPSEGTALAALLEGRRRALELVELDARVRALEAKQ